MAFLTRHLRYGSFVQLPAYSTGVNGHRNLLVPGRHRWSWSTPVAKQQGMAVDLMGSQLQACCWEPDRTTTMSGEHFPPPCERRGGARRPFRASWSLDRRLSCQPWDDASATGRLSSAASRRSRAVAAAWALEHLIGRRPGRLAGLDRELRTRRAGSAGYGSAVALRRFKGDDHTHVRI